MLLDPRHSARRNRRAARWAIGNPRAQAAFHRPLGLERLEPRTLLSGDSVVVFNELMYHPAALNAATGFAGALGPFDGQFDNNGERIELRDNSDRLMDRLDYGDDQPWPLGADGSGASLAKTDPDAKGERPGHWAASLEVTDS